MPANIPTSAREIVTRFLRDWGLEGLGNWAWKRYLSLGGGQLAAEALQVEITDRPEFKTRFPAYHDLVKQGHAMSVAEMLSYEKTAIGMFRAAGIPSGFYDSPQDFASFMKGQVSVAELQQRVSAASEAAFSAPTETKQALQDLYGLDPGHLTAFFLDDKKALPLIQQQYQAGQIAGAANRTGFGTINRQEAERIASLGVTGEQAQQGFGQLAGQQGAIAAQVGENQISQSDQIDAVFGGNQLAQQRIKKRTQTRKNAFGGGSGFSTGQGGVTGLGGKP